MEQKTWIFILTQSKLEVWPLYSRVCQSFGEGGKETERTQKKQKRCKTIAIAVYVNMISSNSLLLSSKTLQFAEAFKPWRTLHATILWSATFLFRVCYHFRERERGSGTWIRKQKKIFCKNYCNSWVYVSMISSNSLLLPSKSLKIAEASKECYMPGPLKCNLYTQEFVKVLERERQGERIGNVNRGRNRRICANYCNSWVYVRHDIKQFFATIFQNCPNCWAFSYQDYPIWQGACVLAKKDFTRTI